MKKYLHYLWYVLRHKFYVYQECRKLGLGFWQSFIHDWSKFLPDEFIPYANYFYGDGQGISKGRDKTGYYKPGESGDLAFDLAWLKHLHRSPHHWQYRFAIEILMPPKLLANDLAGKHIDWLDPLPVSHEDSDIVTVPELAKKYEVPVQIMVMRLTELGYIKL